MKKEDNRHGPEVIDIKNVLSVFKKRKWWFAGVFLIVLLIGIAYNFFIAKEYQYSSSAVVTLTTENLKYQKIISDEYPQEASSLWLSREGKPTNHYFNIFLSEIVRDINSKEFLNRVNDNIDMDLTPGQLERLLLTSHRLNEHFFILNTFYRNPDGAEKIIKTAVSEYKEYKAEHFKAAYDKLATKIEEELFMLGEDLSRVSAEAEEHAVSFNKKLIENISDKEDLSLKLELGGFLPPDLENEIEVLTKRYNYLDGILLNLKNNEDFYIDRIKIISDTGIRTDENFTYFRNVLLSIAAALIFSMIFIYIVDYVISAKNKR
jgi:uncharacterized protein involved in exopolysaccharide biosynthesis